MTGFEEIEKTVLELPLRQRVWLAESLLASLAPVADDADEDSDLAEAERREQEIASGQVQPLDEAELWRRVEAGRCSRFIYRELADGIRVILVRHHRRDPDYGLGRE